MTELLIFAAGAFVGYVLACVISAPAINRYQEEIDMLTVDRLQLIDLLTDVRATLIKARESVDDE